MKICFLIQRFDKPSSRYRVLQYLPAIEKAGFQVEVLEVSGKWWQRLFTLKKAQQFPLVFVQKKLFHSLELRLFKAKGAKLIYDFDDAIMFRHQPVPGSYSATRHRQFIAMIRSSHAVLAGNRFLEQKAKPYGSKVVYLPTTVDVTQYRLKSANPEKEKVTLGWLGSPSTLIYLEQILPALVDLSREFPQIQLKVVSSVFPKEEKLNIIKKQWSKEEEEKDLLSFDIGLAPLNDDLWCEGKCGLKLLQYMACAIPSVASPFGGQRDMIIDGENGFSARNLEEWKQKLARLIKEPQLRAKLGQKGRQSVEEKFSLQKGGEQLIQVLNELKN